MSPIWTLGSVRTNATFYEDIRLSDEWRVGEVNKGWKLITGQLNRERLSLVNHGPVEELYLQTARWAADTRTQSGGTTGEWRPSARPTPLAAKLTKEEAAAHAAFIEQLGDGALWKKGA